MSKATRARTAWQGLARSPSMLGRLSCTFLCECCGQSVALGCGAGERFLAEVPRLFERRSVIQAKKKTASVSVPSASLVRRDSRDPQIRGSFLNPETLTFSSSSLSIPNLPSINLVLILLRRSFHTFFTVWSPRFPLDPPAVKSLVLHLSSCRSNQPSLHPSSPSCR